MRSKIVASIMVAGVIMAGFILWTQNMITLWGLIASQLAMGVGAATAIALAIKWLWKGK